MTSVRKPRVAIHKFSSCDGCQLALLNLGEDLLALAERVELVHFAEAGPLDPDIDVDVAFVEGSVSTAEDLERIRHVRRHSRFLIPIGACPNGSGRCWPKPGWRCRAATCSTAWSRAPWKSCSRCTKRCACSTPTACPTRPGWRSRRAPG